MRHAQHVAEIIASARRPHGLAFQVRRDPPGVLDVPGLENTLLSVHRGGPTRVDCYRAGKHFSGTAVHGDIDIIPRRTPARTDMWRRWKGESRCMRLGAPSARTMAPFSSCCRRDAEARAGYSGISAEHLPRVPRPHA
jgi:hypothetical protein